MRKIYQVKYMETQRKIAFFIVFALVFVWTMAPAAMAEPVKKPATSPSEIKTDTDDADLPEV